MLLFVDICLKTENLEWTFPSGKYMEIVWVQLSVPNELNLNNKIIDLTSSHTGPASILVVFLDDQKPLVLWGNSLPGRKLEKSGPKMHIS